MFFLFLTHESTKQCLAQLISSNMVEFDFSTTNCMGTTGALFGGGFVTKLCLTFCSLPGSSVHGLFQVRILEWVAISFSRGSSPPKIEPGSPALQVDSLSTELPGKFR